jgi:2,5-diketo-D-gluconate reductase B
MNPTADAVPITGGMPRLGLGTWQNDDHEQCVESVRMALEMGYRHIDTAQIYRNEDAVGEGIERASLDRDDIFLATKVWIDNLAPADVRETTEESLDRLGTDYLDLLYVHWPARAYDPEETLPVYDELYDEGVIRKVGVSNFEPHHVDRARDVLDAPLFANQVEMHPFLPQDELRSYAADTDIELVAYSPLARGDVLGHPTLGEIADKHDASEPQVSLSWLREKGVTAIPKATSEAHIRDNWESLNLELDPEDVEQIDAIEKGDRKVDPDFGPAAWS